MTTKKQNKRNVRKKVMRAVRNSDVKLGGTRKLANIGYKSGPNKDALGKDKETDNA